MNKFEELLAKYGKTAEEVTFEIEGLSDEELEAKFVETFEGDGDNDEGSDNGDGDEGAGDGDGEGEGEGEGSDDGNGAGEEKFTKTFTVELSHDDIRYALYNLISQYDEEDNDYYGIRAVYDDYFIMYGWINNKLYKVGYSVDGENVSLEGERQEVFEMILTESEKLAIEKMREDYSALEEKYNELKTFKDNYDAAELKAQKDAIFAKAEYGCLEENEEFATLKADAEKYSVEEISTKADLIFAAHMKSTMEFSANPEEVAKPKVIGLNFSTKERTKKPYGNLFDK